MKISKTVRPLNLVIAAAGTVLLAEVFVDFLNVEAYVLVVSVGALASVASMLSFHADRMERMTMEHARHLSERVLTIERFFGIGVKSNTLAHLEAGELHAPLGDTGPFRAYRGS